MIAWIASLGWLQTVGLAMVAVICAVAVMSVVMRPTRWADRKPET